MWAQDFQKVCSSPVKKESRENASNEAIVVQDNLSKTHKKPTPNQMKIPKRSLAFIHIGKCGGTFLNWIKRLPNEEYFLKEYHLNNKYNLKYNFIVWIRNPIARFVSAFNMSKAIILFDTSKMQANEFNLSNCLEPSRLRLKKNTGITFSQRYDKLIRCFSSANHLAESLTNKNERMRSLAHELMNHTDEHIFKGIGYYLHNGRFVEKFNKKIVFVGRLENMKEDVEFWNSLVGPRENAKTRQNTSNLSKYLSPLAIKNIKEFYKDTDYKALEALEKYNFISKDVLREYNEYNQKK